MRPSDVPRVHDVLTALRLAAFQDQVIVLAQMTMR
jgi:hypothetical protein